MSGQDMRKLMETLSVEASRKYVAANGERIETNQTANVTPNRQWDWSAVLESYDGAEDAGHQYMGIGATEDEAIADLNGQIQDDMDGEMDESVDELAPQTKKITITYEIVTPESAKHGDAEEHGWIDEEGVVMTPDQYDVEDGITAVENAVEFLRNEGGTESSSYPFQPGSWYSTPDGNQDYRTGATEYRSFHLNGFTPEEEIEINQLLKQN